MKKDPAEIKSVQNEFSDISTTLLAVMDSLSEISNPVASAAVQDLSNLTNSLQLLQSRVSEHLHTRKRQVQALVGVGHVINSTDGLEAVLDEVMDAVIALMRAERGLLMLRDEQGKIQAKAARGMDHASLQGDTASVSQTIVRRVAETGESVLTTNAQEDPRFEQQKSVVEHNLRSILCVPLKMKEEIIGVIFVDSRVHSGLFQKNDLRMLSAFADQAAIAIENARMFEELQDAYDATLRGWAITLELRDKETEGHTQRVTTLTCRLAKRLGINGEELENIERGALLHDIGKLAIPDDILLKRGELTLPERKFMELHPEFAKDLLEKIEYLHPAMDIPYCHHEKWDGSGYPRNLRGDEIPFAARIFAVVDVWDALTSYRPYREPLPPEKVRKIIRADSGKHFDPRVVDAFLEMDNLPVSPRIGEIPRPV
jgi:HD-GYP domain-containing protein (c-di-GMP phosphodiesterase class II)